MFFSFPTERDLPYVHCSFLFGGISSRLLSPGSILPLHPVLLIGHDCEQRPDFAGRKNSPQISGLFYIIINQSSYCSITRSGWHLPFTGVAAVSQILCISAALNKRKFASFIIIICNSKTVHPFQHYVNRCLCLFSLFLIISYNQNNTDNKWKEKSNQLE